MSSVDSGVWVFAIVCTGAGLVTGWVERRNATTRALSVWLVVMGLSVAWGGWMLSTGITMAADLLSATLESGAIIAGIEWGRRVALGARGRWRKVASVLFLTAQGVALLFWLLRLGYTLLFPEVAMSPRDGLISARGVEFAVFAPLIGVIMLLSGIALIGLLVVDIDRAERTRVRAFLFASPLLLSGLMLGTVWAPLVMSLGLIVFFAGSIRYLVIQVARGVRMRQFVAAEVAGLVEDDRGLLERRERREISIVACDLRGFTALARELPSEAVMALLERYYAQAGRLAAQHGAAVKDHAGDGILMLVGAPVPVPDAASRALRLARALVEELHPMMQRDAGGLGLGVGVASGDVSIGAVRGAGRLEYAAVGSAVNLAARLCAVAAPGEALIDDATRRAAGIPPCPAVTSLTSRAFPPRWRCSA
jgi:adenylate cyclase